MDAKWGKYLTSDFSDPFILAVFEFALENGFDIAYEAPMTEDLKYQLETYLIPIFAKKVNSVNAFKLIGETASSRIPTENVTGTGFSAGVDSFYSVLKHINSPYESKKVTHLLLTVNGAAGTGLDAKTDKEWFDEEMRRFTILAEEMKLELIGVNSNVSLMNNHRKIFKGGSGITTSSFVHALRKLFGTYYWASAYEADVLEFRTDDLGYVEPFFLPLISVDGLRFYHSGAEANRMEKVEFIADNPVVQKGLTVCGCPDSCGVCFKCTRTMAELYSIDKIEKFSAVFKDAKDYKKKLSRYLGREFAQDHAPFTTEIINSLKKHGKKIPVSAYLWKWFWFKPYLFAKKKLRYNRLAMKLYYEKGWSKRFGEKEQDKDYVRRRLAGEKFEK